MRWRFGVLAGLVALYGCRPKAESHEAELARKGAIKLVTESVSAVGELAVERGTYEETYTLEGARAPVIDRGKYLVYWRRIGGEWLIMADIANSDQPAVPPPPAKQP